MTLCIALLALLLPKRKGGSKMNLKKAPKMIFFKLETLESLVK